MEGGFALVGSPDSITRRLVRYQDEMGFGAISCMFQFGTIGLEQFQRSVTLFADKVLPRLRANSAGPQTAADLVGK
jgi:alkanesulfonate monooxygenase SsuD/methylene tetrahydromethanopterin reductase-like flavin-dependent oxidoreductase (luciferase family)